MAFSCIFLLTIFTQINFTEKLVFESKICSVIQFLREFVFGESMNLQF